jgi:hypothetical protein
VGLSTDEKRCVTSVLEDRIRLLRDLNARREIGVSYVPYRDIGELAENVLAEGADGYGPDGRQHVWILERFVLDVEDYGDWDPWTPECVRLLPQMNDTDVRDFLRELVRVHAPAQPWGIPRGDNLADLKRRLTQT